MVCNSPCESEVSQFNLPTDVAVKAVEIHSLSTKIHTAAPWHHRGPLEHNHEPSIVPKYLCGDMFTQQEAHGP